MRLTPVLLALARRPTLIKLGLRRCLLGRDNYMLHQMALCHTPSLQSLVLASDYKASAELGALAPALYHNKSIKELDVSGNDLGSTESIQFRLGLQHELDLSECCRLKSLGIYFVGTRPLPHLICLGMNLGKNSRGC
jgi:hypothetical protein